MFPQILQVDPLMPAIQSRLDQSYSVRRLWQAPDKTAFAADECRAVRAIVTGGGSGARNELIDALPQLGLIAIHGVGTDAVDLVHARSRGIRVTTTPGVLTDDVADMAIGLLLSVLRRLASGDRFVRARRWGRERFSLGRKVSGRRLGIFGLGQIGQAIARRAAGFDMTISYTDLKPVDGVPYRFVQSLEALAAESEILIVAVSGGPSTRAIVGRAVLDALGPDGVLVNISRGSVIEELELVSALEDGRLAGAGLDVFAQEPHVPEALLTLESVVLQPHQASATVETRVAMGELVLANLEAFFAGRPLPTPVV